MNPFHKIALESLKKNRTRTAVIITGVILSAAMISGVIAFASSLQHFLVEGSIATTGDWYGMAEPVDIRIKENLKKIPEVSETSSYQIKGYSTLYKQGNKYKPDKYVIKTKTGVLPRFSIITLLEINIINIIKFYLNNRI